MCTIRVDCCPKDAVRYYDNLRKFQHAIQTKRRELFNKGIVFVQDNAQPMDAAGNTQR